MLGFDQQLLEVVGDAMLSPAGGVFVHLAVDGGEGLVHFEKYRQRILDVLERRRLGRSWLRDHPRTRRGP